MRGLILTAVLLPSLAFAAPPEPGSEDYELLTPHADWIRNERANGTRTSCCGIDSDCRTVEYRIKGTHYEAMIVDHDKYGYEKWVDAPNAWVIVPDNLVKTDPNEARVATACWSSLRAISTPESNGFWCFWPGALF